MSVSRQLQNIMSENDDQFRKKWDVSGEVSDYSCWNEFISITDGNYCQVIVSLEKKFGFHKKFKFVDKDDEIYTQFGHAIASKPVTSLDENNENTIDEAIAKFTREESEIWTNKNCIKLFTEYLQKYAEDNKYRYTNIAEEILRIRKVIGLLVDFFDELFFKINQLYGRARLTEVQRLDCQVIEHEFQDNANQIIINLDKRDQPQNETTEIPASNTSNKKSHVDCQVIEHELQDKANQIIINLDKRDQPQNKTTEILALSTSDKKSHEKNNNASAHAMVKTLQRKIFNYFNDEKTSIVTGFFGGRKVALISAGKENRKQYATVSDHAELMLNEINKVVKDNNVDKNFSVLKRIAGLACEASYNNHSWRTEETQHFYQCVEEIIDPIASLKRIKQEIVTKTINQEWQLSSLDFLHPKINISNERYAVPKYVKMMWSSLNEIDSLLHKTELNNDEIKKSRDLLKKILNIAQLDSQAKASDRLFRHVNTQSFYKNITAYLVVSLQASDLIDHLEREDKKSLLL